MRGSPLLRTLLLLIVVGATAIGLRILTGPAITPFPAKQAIPTPAGHSSVTPFVLELSKPAKSVNIETLDGKQLAHPACDVSAVLAGKSNCHPKPLTLPCGSSGRRPPFPRTPVLCDLLSNLQASRPFPTSLSRAATWMTFGNSLAMTETHHDRCAHHAHHHELVIDSLCVRYRKVTALIDVSLATSCGNRVALIGPNGAGKSTLLKAIAGLVPRVTGTIRWRGTPVHRWSREFAYLPQREEIDWSFPITVRGLVEMGRYPQTGWSARIARRRLSGRGPGSCIHGLGESRTPPDPRAFRWPATTRFSPRALAQEAHVLLLDEPFTGLDRNAARSLGGLLARLAHEGRLVIASHHDLRTAAGLFDEVLLLNTRQIAFGPAPDMATSDLIETTFSQANV